LQAPSALKAVESEDTISVVPSYAKILKIKTKLLSSVMSQTEDHSKTKHLVYLLEQQLTKYFFHP
jgi:hypothetical protein